MRETTEVAVRGETGLLAEDACLHNACVRIKRAAVITERYRGMLGDLPGPCLSGISNRMNGVMKLFAAVSALPIPINLTAVVYGMVFLRMPGLC